MTGLTQWLCVEIGSNAPIGKYLAPILAWGTLALLSLEERHATTMAELLIRILSRYGVTTDQCVETSLMFTSLPTTTSRKMKGAAS